MLPLFVSYYTLDTGYEQEIKNLINSCEKLSLETDFVGIDSKGKWDQNCCYKPRFLLEMLEKHKRPIVWVDADAVILKKPLFFDSLECDIALRIYEDLPLEHPSKLITGTLFLNDTPAIKTLLELWETKCSQMLAENNKEVWDQIALKYVLLESGAGVNITPLPDPYCAIYDKKKTLKNDAVILHYQASRLFKKVVNKEVAPFWEDHLFSQQNRTNFFS